MAVTSAYLTIIIIWSTTPLAIQWSSIGVGYEFAVALRMVIGLAALLIIVRLWRLPIPVNRDAIKVYFAGGIPLFLAMSSVYWSAQFIPSGWIAVIFGLTPFLTSVFAHFMLGGQSFTFAKSSAMLLGLTGLIIVFAESFDAAKASWMGVMGVSFSAVVHSFGAVTLKKLKPTMPSISVTTGSLLIATPLFTLNSVLHGIPESIPVNSLKAIIYLALMGSALGFPLYYFCLKNLRAEQVALITLITPLTALLLGIVLNGEHISLHIWIGASLIVSGLALYEYGHLLLNKKS